MIKMLNFIVLLFFIFSNYNLYSHSSHPSELGTNPFINDTSIHHYANSEFKKSQNATDSLELNSAPFCFFFNSNKWKIVNRNKFPAQKLPYRRIYNHVNTAEELLFESLDNHFYATIIAENAIVPEKEVKSLVWENVKNEFNRVKFIYEDKRTVNGLSVLHYKIEGYIRDRYSNTPSNEYPDSLNGRSLFLKETNNKWDAPYIFQIYVHVTPESIVQLCVYGLQEEMNSYESEPLEFLNGFSSCP